MDIENKIDEFEDITLVCVECNREFIWSSGDQAFYAKHRLHPVKRCKKCLAKRNPHNK